MKHYISVASFSHIGNSRKNHEDNYILSKGRFLSIRERKNLEKKRKVFFRCLKWRKKDFLIAVSDGMGGHLSGEVASLLTVKYLSDNIRKFLNNADNKETLNADFAKLNKHITDFSKKHTECKNMGATLCGIICKNQKMIGFNIGDSRLYCFKDGKLNQISVDHTEGQRLLNLNLLSEEEVRCFPRRKHLYKYIGANVELTADIFDVEYDENAVFILCSDGLTDVLSDIEIESILNINNDFKTQGQALIDAAIKRNEGYGDNITVVLIEFKEGERYAW